MEDFWKSVQTIQAERGADYRALLIILYYAKNISLLVA